MAPAARCWAAVAVVLTGQRLEPAPDVDWDAGRLVAWLAEQEWDAAALQDRRRRCQAADRPWPEALPTDLIDGLEFARYAAVLAQVRTATGLDGLAERVHHGPAVIGPDETRLLREVPPHSVQR
ncbi:hypothetical protein [Acidipropionibacterium virtanenii]|uniref:hypothetical protein n=1 Tax=Acidipropionibacterium virtanenii TaxID=2057246 RepID=UPI000DED11BD|nr:hypothetical protein [Acidipropionibacterium virtanenii]